VRDEVVDFVTRWSARSGVVPNRLVKWLEVGAGKFHDWRRRYGRVNEHNSWIPRDHWLEPWEKERILEYWQEHPLEGYRRLTFMMLDADVVAVSPSSVYRVLSGAGVLRRWNRKVSKKGTGFVQPLRPHEHWHVDISHLNLEGTFYYLCSVLDGYSRYVVHWEIAAAMKEQDVELVLQRAREKFPEARPRVISDNGPQFIAKDFKAFIRFSGMTHVRTSPYYPQSNGKKERFFKTFKSEGWRPGLATDEESARELAASYIEHYNTRRLHSAIGYVTPADKLAGRDEEIVRERDRKIEEARQRRAENRSRARAQTPEPGAGHSAPSVLAVTPSAEVRGDGDDVRDCVAGG
jgi:transposase InsO family protein